MREIKTISLLIYFRTVVQFYNFNRKLTKIKIKINDNVFIVKMFYKLFQIQNLTQSKNQLSFSF